MSEPKRTVITSRKTAISKALKRATDMENKFPCTEKMNVMCNLCEGI